jgi:hypothetical protein
VLVRRLLDLESRHDAWRWIRTEGAETPPEPPGAVELVVRERPGEFALPDGVVVAPVASWLSLARRYLVDVRGVTPEQAERWELGYAAKGLLAGRIVIPVRDADGRLLSYTARTYLGSAKKFREPDKAEGADKGSVFGERRWPPPGERKLVVVSEAAFDCLAVERATGLCVAGVFGSELLPGHVARLGTFEEIVTASDPDAAGSKLAAQIRAQLGRWRKVRRATFPPGFDADDLARPGADQTARVERLRAILRNAA